jgi:hypothetical protein
MAQLQLRRDSAAGAHVRPTRTPSGWRAGRAAGGRVSPHRGRWPGPSTVERQGRRRTRAPCGGCGRSRRNEKGRWHTTKTAVAGHAGGRRAGWQAGWLPGARRSCQRRLLRIERVAARCHWPSAAARPNSNGPPDPRCASQPRRPPGCRLAPLDAQPAGGLPPAATSCHRPAAPRPCKTGRLTPPPAYD